MNRTSNLSKNDLEDLIRRYYAGEKNSVLIDEFGLDVKANQIHTLFPLIVRHDLSCPYCHINLVQRPLSKSASHYENHNNTAFCEHCSHRNNEYCRCDNCEEILTKQAEELRNQKRDVVRSTHRPIRSNLIDFSTLTLLDALSLASLARVALDEKENKILPLKSHALSFCVRQSTTLLTLERLFEKELIEIALESDLKAISLSEENKPVIHLELASWEFRLGKNSDESLHAIELIEKMFRNKNEWPPSWEQEIADIWKELALEEVLSYFELKLSEHKFNPRIGAKTIKVFLSLLQDLPITKIYNLIWVSVTNATAYQVRSSISKQQAANSVIGNCQQRAERALNEQWSLKGYKKDYRIPDSTRINIFSNVITDLGDNFYNETPIDANVNNTSFS